MKKAFMLTALVSALALTGCDLDNTDSTSTKPTQQTPTPPPTNPAQAIVAEPLAPAVGSADIVSGQYVLLNATSGFPDAEFSNLPLSTSAGTALLWDDAKNQVVGLMYRAASGVTSNDNYFKDAKANLEAVLAQAGAVTSSLGSQQLPTGLGKVQTYIYDVKFSTQKTNNDLRSILLAQKNPSPVRYLPVPSSTELTQQFRIVASHNIINGEVYFTASIAPLSKYNGLKTTYKSLSEGRDVVIDQSVF